MSICTSTQILSSIGSRPSNEDVYQIIYIRWNPDTKRLERVSDVSQETEWETQFPYQMEYYAIYDGHGGHQVAQFLGQHLCDLYMSHLPTNLEGLSQSAIDSALKQSFACMTDLLATHPEWENIGSTALVVIVVNRQVTIALLGDSRVSILRHDHVVPLTVDQNLEHEIERERTLQRLKERHLDVSHLRIIRGWGWRLFNLNMSATFGNLKIGQYLTTEPVINHYTLTSDDLMLVIACDGVWSLIDELKTQGFIFQRRSDIIHHINLEQRLCYYRSELCQLLLEIEHSVHYATDNLTMITIEM